MIKPIEAGFEQAGFEWHWVTAPGESGDVSCRTGEAWVQLDPGIWFFENRLTPDNGRWVTSYQIIPEGVDGLILSEEDVPRERMFAVEVGDSHYEFEAADVILGRGYLSKYMEDWLRHHKRSTWVKGYQCMKDYFLQFEHLLK